MRTLNGSRWKTNTWYHNFGPAQTGGPMKLERFDYVQLAGVFATNPLTGAQTAHLQGFAVTEPVDGDVIPRHALHPFVTPIEEPILMSRVVTVNCLPVEEWKKLNENGTLPQAGDTPPESRP